MPLPEVPEEFIERSKKMLEYMKANGIQFGGDSEGNFSSFIIGDFEFVIDLDKPGIMRIQTVDYGHFIKEIEV